MEEQQTTDFKKPIDEKETRIKELEQKIQEIEQKFNELKTELEKKILDRTLEAKRLLLHKTKFIDNLSHDLGTPLTPILTLLPMIKEKIENPELKEYIDTCIRNAEYIKRVVEDTRKLAELNTTDLYLKDENLFEIVNNLKDKYDVIFNTLNIETENYIEKNVFVKTEKKRLLQVLDHITSNAVNSMPNGGKITFNANKVEKKIGTFINVSIADTGEGLTRDQTEHLFDEFFKADESRHKLDSTGLGLTICKRIVEKHGGKIWADIKDKGQGVTIRFTIPSA